MSHIECTVNFFFLIPQLMGFQIELQITVSGVENGVCSIFEFSYQISNFNCIPAGKMHHNLYGESPNE